jgi:hypothetical protein
MAAMLQMLQTQHCMAKVGDRFEFVDLVPSRGDVGCSKDFGHGRMAGSLRMHARGLEKRPMRPEADEKVPGND